MREKTDRLFEVAERQQGFFTAGQAVACGYPTSSHVYHQKAGTWQREYRGIYRLLIRVGIQADKVKEAVCAIFGRRGTHTIPVEAPPPAGFLGITIRFPGRGVWC